MHHNPEPIYINAPQSRTNLQWYVKSRCHLCDSHAQLSKDFLSFTLSTVAPVVISNSPSPQQLLRTHHPTFELDLPFCYDKHCMTGATSLYYLQRL